MFIFKLDWTGLLLAAHYIIPNRLQVKVIQLWLTLYSPWNSPGQNTGVGSLSLLQGIFQPRDWTQVSCIGRWILYRLSHQGAHRVLWTSLNGKGWSADLLPPTRLPGWRKSGVLPGDRTREVGQELQLFWVLLCKGDHTDKGEWKSCPSVHSFIEH